MANSKSSAFRERFTEIDKGIKVEQPKRMPSVEGLKLDTSFDLSQLGSFTSSPVEIKGVAEKVKPQGMGDLRVDTDLSKLDESIEKIKRQQVDERIRGLLEEAERLIAGKKYRPALKPLDEAIDIAPTSAQALFLKGYSLFCLGEYYPALDALEEARRYAREGETVLLILTLQAACMRAAAEEVEVELADLIEQGKFSQALSLIESELSRHPADAVMLYYKSLVFLIMGRAEDAKRAARNAIQRVGDENAELFYGLLDHIILQENMSYLEKARVALRRGNPAEAIRQLEICRTALLGKEQFEAVWAYAQEKRPRGVLSSIFSRNRSMGLSEDTRQRLLQWLLDEELREGAEALANGKFDAAAAIFDKAARIDSRCNFVCFLHGAAIFNGLRLAMENQQALPDLDRSIQNLEHASQLLQYASSDQVVGAQSSLLLKAVNNDISQFLEIKREIARRAAEAKSVNDLIQEFNSLMDSLERDPVKSPGDLDRAEKRFNDVKQKAEKLRRSRSKNEGGEILGQIIAAVDRNVRQLREIRNDMKKYQSVNECVAGFQAMMDYFTRNPISNRRELDMARSMVTALKDKIAAARREHLVGSDARQVLEQVEEAVRKVESQLY